MRKDSIPLLPEAVDPSEWGTTGSEESGTNIRDVAEVHASCVSPAPLMFVNVLLHGSEHRAMIDTGATVSLIKESLCGRAHKTTDSKVIRGLGDTKIASPAVVDMEFWLGPLNFVEDFRVVPEDTTRHDIVLGSSFLVENNITVDYPWKISGPIGGGRWEFHVGGSEMHLDNLELELCNEEIVGEEAVLCEVRIRGNTRLSERDMYFSSEEMHQGCCRRVRAESGLVDLAGGRTRVLIENIDDLRRTTLKLGTVIGTVSTTIELAVADLPPNRDQEPVEDLISKIALDELSEEEQIQARQMFRRQEGVFSRGDSDIGCAGVTKHKIELYDSAPIRMKPRRFSEPVAREIDKQCNELLRLDVIKPSRSPWSAPIVPIWKKDGTLRMCVDYRKLNNATKPDRFPVPNMTDMVFGLQGMTYFTTLDLVKGYYQVPLDPASTEYTAFSTPSNHYEFKRLSFGLKNAPAAFQREMQEILKGFDGKRVMVYLDDIMIMSRSYREHLTLVEQVLATLRAYEIKIKPAKCSFFKQEAKYLGHVVSKDGLRKSDDYVKAVTSFPKPQDVKQLRSFLGLVNFQRKFIKDCSIISKPLSGFLGMPDRATIIWTPEMETAFDALREAMKEDLLLTYPDYQDSATPMELATDACRYGAGACLSQNQGGEDRVIAYASTSFNRAQANYSVFEQELDAIRWAVKAFRSFLAGVPFTLYTDHRPLVYMSNMSKINPRMMRTLNELAEFDFTIKYKPGKLNGVADALSRVHQECERDERDVSTGPPHGLKVLKLISGGGNSLVESLMEVLGHHREQQNPDLVMPEDSTVLRQVLVKEILDDPTKYLLDNKRSTRSLIRLWSLKDVLPPHEFVDAFANVYGLQVWVHHNFIKPEVHYPQIRRGTVRNNRVHLQCLESVHFNPLVETLLYKPPSTMDTLELNLSEMVEVEPDLTDGPLVEGSLDIFATLAPDCGCPNFNGIAKTSVILGNKRYCALIDTGAQVSLLKKGIRDQLLRTNIYQVRCNTVAPRIRTVGGHIVGTQGVADLKWSFDGEETFWGSFVLVEDHDMPVCAILGADLIKKLGISLNFQAREFSFRGKRSEKRIGFNVYDCEVATVEFCFLQEHLGVTPIGIGDFPFRLSKEEVLEIQKSDPILQKLTRVLKLGLSPRDWKDPALKAFRKGGKDINILEEVLVWNRGGSPRVVGSVEHLAQLCPSVHREMSHPGKNRLEDLMKKVFWHPALAAIVKDTCRTCEACQTLKTSPQLVKPPIVRMKFSRPCELVSVDLLMLPKTRRGNIGCLVGIDHCSKWASVVPIRNKKSDTVAKTFENVMLPALPRVPDRVLSDNGPEFVAGPFAEVLQNYRIKHSFSTPYHPSSNGAVERLNQTISQMLRCDNEERDWDEKLARVVINYNNSIHSTLGVSPADFILYSDHGRGEQPSDESLWKTGHSSYAPFEVGTRVLKKTILQGHLTTNKLEPRYSGPYTVKRVLENEVAYVLVDEIGREIRAHHSQLKKYHEVPEYLRREIRMHAGHTLEEERPESEILEEYSTDDESVAGEVVESSTPRRGPHRGMPGPVVSKIGTSLGLDIPWNASNGPLQRSELSFLCSDINTSLGLKTLIRELCEIIERVEACLDDQSRGLGDLLDRTDQVLGGSAITDSSRYEGETTSPLGLQRSERSNAGDNSGASKDERTLTNSLGLRSEGGGLSNVRNVVGEGRTLGDIPIGGGPYMGTRSRGRAPDYPNVQGRPIEYK